MSYDLYCYKSKSSRPSIEEALRIIEIDEERGEEIDTSATKAKNDIVNALIEANPRFRDNGGVLDLPEGDSSIQIFVNDHYVSISIPYWYKGVQCEAVFEELLGYLKAIRKVAGYMVYDPQTDKAFNPQEESTIDTTAYRRGVQMVEKVYKKRSWWKFWK